MDGSGGNVKTCVNSECRRRLADDTEVCGSCGTRQPGSGNPGAGQSRQARNQAVGDTSAQSGGIAQGGAGNVQQNAPRGKIFNFNISLFGLLGRPARTRSTSSGPESAAVGAHGPRSQRPPSALSPTPRVIEAGPDLPKMRRKVYGPRDVFVPLNPPGTSISYLRTYGYLKDLDAQALIHIPYSRREGEWSAGFRLRATSYGSSTCVFISSDGCWYCYRQDSSGHVEVVSGRHEAIRVEFPGANFVRVVADGKVGALIINEALPVWLQLPERPRGGMVHIVASFFDRDGVAGKAVQFERLEIRGR